MAGGTHQGRPNQSEQQLIHLLNWVLPIPMLVPHRGIPPSSLHIHSHIQIKGSIEKGWLEALKFSYCIIRWKQFKISIQYDILMPASLLKVHSSKELSCILSRSGFSRHDLLPKSHGGVCGDFSASTALDSIQHGHRHSPAKDPSPQSDNDRLWTLYRPATRKLPAPVVQQWSWIRGLLAGFLYANKS